MCPPVVNSIVNSDEPFRIELHVTWITLGLMIDLVCVYRWFFFQNRVLENVSHIKAAKTIAA